MERDIPNSMVVILIVVVFVASIAGTWIISDKLEEKMLEADEIGGTNQGNIGLLLIRSDSGTPAGNVGLTKIK